MNSKELPIKIQLPEGFLDEEHREGCIVSAELKALWAVELDLLAELDRVCKKHNLRYFANGGTLLGAVRHGGFIPWDDDIDVNMPRADYERLCAIASEEFAEPYFWQTNKTDPSVSRVHAQLRNSLTTAIPRNNLQKDRMIYPTHSGVFIDIFPMDKLPERQDEREQFVRELTQANHKLASHIAPRSVFLNPSIELLWHPRRMVLFIRGLVDAIRGLFLRQSLVQKFYDEFELLAQKYNGIEGSDYSQLTFDLRICQKLFLPVWCYDTPQRIPFEFVDIPVPLHYDDYLERQYGDWQTPKKIPSYHGDMMIDLRRSYKEYL